MAGPCVGLWLPAPLTFEQVTATVAPWLQTFCAPVETGPDAMACWVRDGGPLGLPAVDPTDGRPLYLSMEAEPWADGDDLSGLPWRPQAELAICAGAAGPLDHRVLAAVALALARRFDALVSFDGLLGDHQPSGTVTMAEAAAAARALIGPTPGRLWEVSYDLDDGGRWSYHVGDADFLAAWLRHPRFRLVK